MPLSSAPGSCSADHVSGSRDHVLWSKTCSRGVGFRLSRSCSRADDLRISKGEKSFYWRYRPMVHTPPKGVQQATIGSFYLGWWRCQWNDFPLLQNRMTKKYNSKRYKKFFLSFMDLCANHLPWSMISRVQNRLRESTLCFIKRDPESLKRYHWSMIREQMTIALIDCMARFWTFFKQTKAQYHFPVNWLIYESTQRILAWNAQRRVRYSLGYCCLWVSIGWQEAKVEHFSIVSRSVVHCTIYRVST